MHKHPKITEARILKTLERIRPLIYPEVAPLRIEAWAVGGEPVSYGTATGQTYATFRVGEPWGVPWDTVWFRFREHIPADWAGKEVVALIELGAKTGEGFTCEGQVWQDGVPTRAINAFRADVPLASPAAGGEEIDFYVEAAANPHAVGSAERIAPRGETQPIFRLEQAELACVNREAQAYYDDFRLAAEALAVLPQDGPRYGKLLYALNESANRLDPAAPSTVPAARLALAGVMSSRNGDSAHQISAIGHAHIDTAWLWPLRETIRKCARTFSTVLAYMEEYPDYVFCCSQPQQYAWMKEYYPTIYEGIKQAVKRGQWEPIGSMWVEPDCNLPSGESLVRQILHGKNFFLDEFGYETTELWIPDVFGYSAALPQLMRQSGIHSFVTQKISWSQFNKFPHHTFLWEGLDGTQIFSHFPPADTYNADITAKQLRYVETNFREHDRANRSLLVYGWGDGGGGPTKGMLEAAARVRDFEGLPKVTLEKISDFLAKAKDDARDLPVWVGELYLEFHRGTYTTQARNKRGNRQSEQFLHDAEFFSVLTPGITVTEADKERAVYDVTPRGEPSVASYLDRAWKLLLLNQFHDIIPGSSISWVYEDSGHDYETIARLCEAVTLPARGQLAAEIDTTAAERPVIVFNTTAFPRAEVVSLPDGKAAWVEAGSCGYAVNDLAVPIHVQPVHVSTSAGGITLDNGILRVHLDREGQLVEVYDQRTRRRVLAPGSVGNILQLHRDYPNRWDAWDIDIHAAETVENITALESMEVVETDPLRAVVKLVRRFGRSALTQQISLRAASARLDFEMDVDWQESHKLLKVAFPVNVHSMRATYETQFGHVERPTHYNTSWDLARFEVCGHQWADLSEGDYGVALLNDCKYGHDILGHTMRLSLLRSPGAPDPTADRGAHKFTYALFPHAGSFQMGGVIAEARSLNAPLHLVEAERQPGTRPARESFFEVDRPAVLIDTIKKAEREDAIIVRLYEAHQTRGPVTFKTSLPVRSISTADLMERTLQTLPCKDNSVTFDIAPFEIVTLKLLL